MSRSTTRRALAVGAIAVALLAGCAEEVPQPNPDPVAETPAPALDADRMDRVLEEIGSTVQAADEARDPAALAPRVTGPAADVRAAQYRLAQVTEDQVTPPPLTSSTQVEAVAATQDFPRTAMVITNIPEGGMLPVLMTLTQDSARDQFKLWGWAEAFPGTETPAMIHPDTGSAQLPSDAQGLVATPAEVLARYVDVLGNPESEFAAQFAEDPYRTQSQQQATQLDTAVEAAGEAARTAEVGDSGPLALATADGGALVMGELRSHLTIRKTVPGATLNAGGIIGELLGDDKEVRGTVTASSDVVVAFYVPPADAEDTTIKPLGATPVITGVTRDDAAAPAPAPAP